MIQHREVLFSGNPNPHQSQRVRQHPVARHLMEQFGEDDPMLVKVLCKLEEFARFNVEITPQVVDNVIAWYRRDEALIRQGVFAYRPAAKQTYRERPGAPKNRFAGITTDQPVVYYARIGNRVKIGTTTDLSARMRDINPEELMVAEYGGLGRERERHQRFAELRTHGEWFRLEGELVEHIEKLQAQLASD